MKKLIVLIVVASVGALFGCDGYDQTASSEEYRGHNPLDRNPPADRGAAKVPDSFKELHKPNTYKPEVIQRLGQQEPPTATAKYWVDGKKLLEEIRSASETDTYGAAVFILGVNDALGTQVVCVPESVEDGSELVAVVRKYLEARSPDELRGNAGWLAGKALSKVWPCPKKGL